MGFDLNSIKPKDPNNDYFRNSVWSWRPLWNFVAENCDNILTYRDVKMGSYNDGYKISKSKAIKIANKLDELVNSGEVAQYARDYEKAEEGSVVDENGETLPIKYPFSVDNVLDFSRFCRNSGGFEIF
tara:strand:+ start:2697 stop:3080 length:384 start_codon:yes stop_codon:yes gene_type:complete